MDTQIELLSLLDLLDMNEEDVDKPLKYIMEKSKHSNKHLRSAAQLLQYKLLVNAQEHTECENDEEFEFVVKLLKDLCSKNVDHVCKIIDIVLRLQPSKLVSKAEHLLQQILSNIEVPVTDRNTLLYLKAADSILNVAITFGEKLSLLFLETPLEKILDSPDEALRVYFLTNTVPRLVDGSVGYNILDSIWIYIQSLTSDKQENALKVLSCLSDYYLPTPDGQGDSKFVSDIIFQSNFWEMINLGITSDDTAIRKISVYLTKKAVDCVMATKKDINIKSSNQTIFQWKKNNADILKTMWDNFFVLIDSLEEKQGNIVLPSLKLFENINVGDCWMTAAFNMGLKHENTQVRLKCIEYKLKTKVRNQSEAQILLEALNDINIYDQSTIFEVLKQQTAELLSDSHSFVEIFKAITYIKWSPVPLYHITDILANLEIDLSIIHGNDISKIIIDIQKIPCNNVVLRKAIQINMVYFVQNCYKNINWIDLVNIYNNSLITETSCFRNPFSLIVKRVSLTEKLSNLKTVSEHYSNIELLLLYLHYHQEDTNLFINLINEKINKLQEDLNRQYADKKDCLNDVVFLIHLMNKAGEIESFLTESEIEEVLCTVKSIFLNKVNERFARQNKTLIQYFQILFLSEVNLTIDDLATLYEEHNFVFNDKDLGDILLQLYKTAVIFLKENPELNKAVLSIFTLKMLLKNPVMLTSYKHEMLNLKRFIEVISTLKFKDAQNESVGRSKNVFYEKSCEIIYLLIEEEEAEADLCLQDIINYIETVLECGGYGCLKWILKIVNKIINSLTEKNTNFNMIQFVNRVWTEIEELKSNNQYSPCIEQFVDLITQDALLKNVMYNNIVISYCNKIIENGPVKTNPLYYLIRRVNSKDVKVYGHLIYVLCEILLYCPVPRKDQRIVDNVTLEVLQNFPKYRQSIDIHFNFEIQYLAIATLCNIKHTETLRMITNFITIRIDNTFKNKQRYHGYSTLHRVLLTTLQHILVLILKNGDLENVFTWCLDMLVKLPHQPSVRICLEWFLSLYFYIQKTQLNEETLQILKTKKIPITSQFVIFYWLLKHKISNSTYTENEYDFVMDFLLSHTMGQLFNVRLNAQYLATSVYKLAKKAKYEYTIDVINKTFAESNSDKNYLKLKSDYFINDFDIIANLTPYFIYYLLPKFCEIDNNENLDLRFIQNIMQDINKSISRSDQSDFINEWAVYRNADDKFELYTNKGVDSKGAEDSETMGTIQKKYIPWKNMSDVHVYDVEKKRESPSQLIVVASLIDKLPNLGGMARTSEVFGVHTYVVDSLRHLQDKQFQGLSVSAEKWINVEEVRPGRPLKEYLMRKKGEGYAVVAAEQTSTSSKLQGFKFPKKTLLLLGHEKEGVPCDLLPLMDHCVEIPQQGYVRSLNVHVTAAIFVWEYARQNIL